MPATTQEAAPDIRSGNAPPADDGDSIDAMRQQALEAFRQYRAAQRAAGGDGEGNDGNGAGMAPAPAPEAPWSPPTGMPWPPVGSVSELAQLPPNPPSGFNRDGTYSLRGDRKTIRDQLDKAGITLFLPIQGGLMIGTSQAQRAHEMVMAQQAAQTAEAHDAAETGDGSLGGNDQALPELYQQSVDDFARNGARRYEGVQLADASSSPAGEAAPGSQRVALSARAGPAKDPAPSPTSSPSPGAEGQAFLDNVNQTLRETKGKVTRSQLLHEFIENGGFARLDKDSQRVVLAEMVGYSDRLTAGPAAGGREARTADVTVRYAGDAARASKAIPEEFRFGADTRMGAAASTAILQNMRRAEAPPGRQGGRQGPEEPRASPPPPAPPSPPPSVPGVDYATVKGQKFYPEHHGTLYHGTDNAHLGLPASMRPEEAAQHIYTNGLPARGSNTDLQEHASIHGAPDTAYRGTTVTPVSQQKDAGAVYWAGDDGLVVKIKGKQGYDVNKILELGGFGGHRTPAEQEIAVAGAIRPEDIQRVGRVSGVDKGNPKIHWIERTP